MAKKKKKLTKKEKNNYFVISVVLIVLATFIHPVIGVIVAAWRYVKKPY